MFMISLAVFAFFVVFSVASYIWGYNRGTHDEMLLWRDYCTELEEQLYQMDKEYKRLQTEKFYH